MILVTGGTGFVGSHLKATLKKNGIPFLSVIRDKGGPLEKNERILPSSFLESDFIPLLDSSTKIDSIIHCAGLAHGKVDTDGSIFEQYQKVNVDYPVHLAKAALSFGVKKFIFISSIGVHGSSSYNGAINENSPLCPENMYTKSKLEAETRLHDLFEKEDNAELIIVRPPLIYGLDAPGNFKLLLKVSKLPIPMPLKSVNNKRSLISITNLVDFLIYINERQGVSGEYLVSDGKSVSTGDIIRFIRKGFNGKSMLFPFPPYLLEKLANLMNRPELFVQLCGDLRVNSSKAMSIGWVPKISTGEALSQIGIQISDRSKRTHV